MKETIEVYYNKTNFSLVVKKNRITPSLLRSNYITPPKLLKGRRAGQIRSDLTFAVFTRRDMQHCTDSCSCFRHAVEKKRLINKKTHFVVCCDIVSTTNFKHNYHPQSLTQNTISNKQQ